MPEEDMILEEQTEEEFVPEEVPTNEEQTGRSPQGERG